MQYRSLAAAVLAIAFAATASTAEAQDFSGTAPGAPAKSSDKDNSKQADALFREGRRLLASGDYDAACATFIASNDAEPSIGALLNLGECELRRDDPTAAWLALRRAELIAKTLGDNERASFARSRMKRLDQRLGFVTLQIDRRWRGAGLVVTIDGRRLIGPEIDHRIPLSAGGHQLRASAPGARPFERELTGEPGVATTLAIELEPAVTRPAAPLATAPPPRPTPGRDDGGASARELVGISMTAAGGAALAVGITIGALARSQWNSVQSCRERESPPCTADEIARGDAAERKANIATGVVVGGLAVAGAGLALWLTAPDERPEPAGVAVAPVVDGGFVGLSASGRF